MQSLALKIKGLYSHASELSEVPDGALQVADNIVIDKESVAQPRRGFDRLATGFSDSAYRANKVFFYQDKLLAHYSSNLMAYYSSGVWTAYSGTYAPVANGNSLSSYTTLRTRAVQANQNFYFTTSSGIKKLDAYNSTPVISGAYKALDIQASTSASSSTWLTDDYRVAYRVIWGYKDANNNLILGAPSQRESFKNTAGSTKAVDLSITIPDGVTTAWFFQVYRSAAVDNTAEDIEPSDELGLVYEANPTSGEISAKLVTVTDITPDELRGATIYTAATQEGLAAGNETPPLAKDIAVFKNVVFYANTVSKHRYYLTLLAAGGSSGIDIGDTITIGGITYTAGISEDATVPRFRVATGSFTFVDADVNTGTDAITKTAHGLSDGDTLTLTNSGGALPGGLSAATTYYVVSATANTFELSLTSGGASVDITSAAGGGTHTVSYPGGSASQNIRDTALSLVRVINRHTSSTVTAYYLSGPDDLPGKLLIEEEDVGSASFAVTSSVDTCWNPSLPTSGTTESSTNDAFKNGIYFSKTSQPESVPLTNFFFAGSADSEILRIIPLRDSVFVLKEDGIYRISGEDASSFRVDLFDSTTRLIAPESAVVLNNQIYALTDQGVVAITEGGVQVKSRPIEVTLLSLIGEDLDALRNLSFAVSYETERKYILFVPTISGDTTATQAFVYNTFTNTWTRWTLAKTCGIVDPENDVLYLGDASSNFVNNERKSLSYLDYADYGGVTSITAVSSTSLTLSSVEDVDVGDIIYQSASVLSTVTAVDTDTRIVTVSGVRSFTVAACTILKAISSKISWVPFTMGNPGTLKQYREVSLLFKKDFSGEADLVFSSDVSGSPETEPLTGTGSGRWGSFAWGRVPWGGRKKRRPIRVIVPRNKQRCSQLTCEFRHATAYTDYQLNGISLIAQPGSERISG